MLDQWYGQYVSSVFSQNRIEAPVFDPQQLEVANKVADYNFKLSQSIPTYFNFTTGDFRFIFFGLGVVFALGFFYSLYCNLNSKCQK
jgi:hypothetical protein